MIRMQNKMEADLSLNTEKVLSASIKRGPKEICIIQQFEKSRTLPSNHTMTHSHYGRLLNHNCKTTGPENQTRFEKWITSVSDDMPQALPPSNHPDNSGNRQKNPAINNSGIIHILAKWQ